jgi:glycine oxidase
MRCAVVGGGIIGLAVAWRLARRGVDVTVYDPVSLAASAGGAGGAWWVAAGMLAPGGESVYEKPALAALLAESARRWPGFARELTADTGHDLGYDDAGTLSVALTADDVAEASRAWRRQRLTPTVLRDLDPALSPRIRAGVHAPADHQVDPWRVVAALRATGVPVVPQHVDDLGRLDADRVVVAAGMGAAALTGLPVRPVKGQLLRLRGEPGLLRHVISGYADGRHVYLVPRADGDIVVGATQEERTDHTVTAGGVLDLLRAAVDLVPALAELELAETVVGHRPATPDNAPLLGRLDARTVVAAGHHRNGVLLAPLTADLVADLVVSGEAHPLLAAFDPGRFSCS